MQTKGAKIVLLHLGRTMMSVLAFLTLSSLLLFTTSVDARKDPAEYWKDVMKDQQMPEEIQGLLRSIPGSLCKEKKDCHTTLETQKLDEFNWDSNIQSTAIIYHKHDENDKEEKIPMKNFDEQDSSNSSTDVRPEEKKSFVEVFEPRPNISVYDDGIGKN